MKIGLCTGCFDLLHEGHLYFLEQAEAACDYLIVAVNSDRSVARLKGINRPVQTLNDRMLNIMARAPGCGALVPFDGSTERLIMAIRPDVVISGYDHGTVNEEVYAMRVPGWKNGVEDMDIIPVIRAKHLKGFSTTLQILASVSKTNS